MTTHFQQLAESRSTLGASEEEKKKQKKFYHLL